MNQLSRRQFIRAATVTSMVLNPSTVGVAVCESKARKARLIPGLNAYSFADALNANMVDSSKGLDLFGVCDFCAEHDIDAVDLTGYFFPGYPAAPSDHYLRRMKRHTHQLGITISGTGIRNDFATADRSIRADGVLRAKTWIEVAAKLGAPVIRLFAGPQGSIKDWRVAANGASRPEVESWMSDAIRQCAEHAEKFGVIVGIQNHGDFISTAEEHLSLLKRVDHPWCGALVDTGMYLTEDPYRDIAMMTPHAVNWQVKETLASSLKSPRVDMNKLVRVLLDGGFRGFVPIETLAMGRKDYHPSNEILSLLKAMREALLGAS